MIVAGMKGDNIVYMRQLQKTHESTYWGVEASIL